MFTSNKIFTMKISEQVLLIRIEIEENDWDCEESHILL